MNKALNSPSLLGMSSLQIGPQISCIKGLTHAPPPTPFPLPLRIPVILMSDYCMYRSKVQRRKDAKINILYVYMYGKYDKCGK